MPLYEYECEACHDRFEVIQKVDASQVSRCRKCQGKARRMISAPSFRFRGSGWYVTDYGKGKRPPSEKSGEKPAKPDDASPKRPGGKSSGKKTGKD